MQKANLRVNSYVCSMVVVVEGGRLLKHINP